MVPLLVLLLFAAPPITAADPAAPRAHNPGDFRLAAEVVDGDFTSRAAINVNETSTTADGQPWARVYVFGKAGGALGVFVSHVRFDCAGRTLFTEYVWQLDRNLEVVGETAVNQRSPVTPQSVGAQKLDFMCGSRAVQLQRPYLGSDWKSAIRLADARFR